MKSRLQQSASHAPETLQQSTKGCIHGLAVKVARPGDTPDKDRTNGKQQPPRPNSRRRQGSPPSHPAALTEAVKVVKEGGCTQHEVNAAWKEIQKELQKYVCGIARRRRCKWE